MQFDIKEYQIVCDELPSENPITGKEIVIDGFSFVGLSPYSAEEQKRLAKVLEVVQQAVRPLLPIKAEKPSAEAIEQTMRDVLVRQVEEPPFGPM